MLKYVLLGALTYQPLTGYQLKQFIDNSARHFWYAQTSQIYRTLNELEEKGLLTSQIQPQTDRPDQRLYHLTPTGREDLLKWLATPMTEIAPTKDELLVRLFFSALLDKEVVLTQLRLQKALHQQQLSVFKEVIPLQITTSLERNPHLKRDALLWELDRRLGELSEESYLRWLDETIARIEEEF
jgi:DNA-binding PadR family transcriptional regulator